MRAVRETLRAKTEGELRELFEEAAEEARAMGLEPEWAFEQQRIKKTAAGYEISFCAHA
jgi:hypothetical protein